MRASPDRSRSSRKPRLSGGAGTADDSVEQQGPDGCREVEDPRVAEELAQVAANVGCLRRVGCAELDQQDADRGIVVSHGMGNET